MGFWNELADMHWKKMAKMWFKVWGTMALAYLAVLAVGIVIAVIFMALFAGFTIGVIRWLWSN